MYLPSVRVPLHGRGRTLTMVHEGVLLCPPVNLVEFMGLVRGAGIKLHLAKAAGKNVNGAGEKIRDFIAGKGREAAISRRPDQIDRKIACIERNVGISI